MQNTHQYPWHSRLRRVDQEFAGSRRENLRKVNDLPVRYSHVHVPVSALYCNCCVYLASDDIQTGKEHSAGVVSSALVAIALPDVLEPNSQPRKHIVLTYRPIHAPMLLIGSSKKLPIAFSLVQANWYRRKTLQFLPACLPASLASAQCDIRMRSLLIH